MRVFSRWPAAATLLAATLLVNAPASATGLSVRTLAAQEAELATIAHRIARANAHACRHPQMMTGMILHDLTQYSPAQRAHVSRAFSLRSGFGILQIVPGSSAAQAGLRIDDEIIAVGKAHVEDPVSVGRSAKSARRIENFSTLLQSNLRHGPAALLVRRAGRVHRVDLHGERGCGGQVSLEDSSSLNAWADGKHILLTTAMAQFARSKDEIAFVIAHEMAHNILGHVGRGNGSHGIFGIGNSRSRNRELNADIYAVQLMSQAGYRPDAGVSFLHRSSRRLWWAFSLDHPGFGRRIHSVQTAIARLKPASPPWTIAAAEQAATPVAPAAGATYGTGNWGKDRHRVRSAPALLPASPPVL